jgi:hypothetical protein
MRGWIAIAILGCTGETVTAPAVDAGGKDTSTAACSPVAENLLKNPSFEEWNGTTIANWTYENKVAPRRRDTGAADCKSWLEFERACYESISQRVPFSPPLPAGTVIEVGVSLRHVGGTYDQLNLDIELDDGSQVGPLHSINDGWGIYTATRTLDKPSSFVGIVISGDDCEQQTFGVDRAWLIIKK